MEYMAVTVEEAYRIPVEKALNATVDDGWVYHSCMKDESGNALLIFWRPGEEREDADS